MNNNDKKNATPVEADQKQSKQEWYKHGWGLVAAILLFPYFIIWFAWAKSKWSKGVKVTVTAVVAVLLLFVFIGMANTDVDTTEVSKTEQDQAQSGEATQEKVEEKPQEKTAREAMLESVTGLIDSKDAFDTGSYVKGDIPTGEYAFISFDGSGKYYSEEDSAGNIVDNENFDSFGYVYVHGVGNLKTDGVLIKVNAFKKIKAKSAKEIYEKLNDVADYKDSAMYKVGVDIAPGAYTIKSLGEAYVAVTSGPVGDSEIIDNNNFKGKYSVNVSAGQYLKVSRGTIQ